MTHPSHQRIDGDLLQHKTSVITRTIDPVRIPLPKIIIRSRIDRMIKIISPRIQCQLVESTQIELRSAQNPSRGLLQYHQRALDQLVIRPISNPHSPNEKRNRPEPLVLIRLQIMTLERRDRTITHIVVQLANRTRNDPVELLPRSTLLERRLNGPTQKQTVEDPLRLLMKKKVAVEVQVIGQQRSPYQFDHSRGLLALCKGRIASPQTLQTL